MELHNNAFIWGVRDSVVRSSFPFVDEHALGLLLGV
jgi:hypothetical protein